MVVFMVTTGLFGEVILRAEVTGVTEGWSVPNPIGFVPDVSGPVVDDVWNLALLTLTGAALLSVVLRFVRSKGVERQQMKWLLFAVLFFAAVFGGAALIRETEDAAILDLLLPASLIGIAIAVAVAVLRYRLYEIDRIVSRTISYAIVVGVLLGAVALVATIVGAQFDSPPVVAATTLGVAAVFNPLRRRVQVVVDRRFNRSRYDAERVMDDFAGSLRDRTDAGEVLDGWVEVVADTMQPSRVGVWVRFS
jgi:hypothetical protein